MADTTKKEKTTKKIIDVAAPSTTLPSPNSRSIIVSHGSIVKDNTIVEDGEEETTNNNQPFSSLSGNKKLTIQPLSDFKLDPEPKVEEKPSVEASDTLSTEVSVDDKPIGEAEEIGEDKTEEASDDNKVEVKTDSDHTDEVDQNQTTKSMTSTETEDSDKSADDEKSIQEKEAEKAKAEHEQVLDELVENKSYFLPINSVKIKRNQRIVLLGLGICIILIIVWLDIALDTGIINNTYNLPHTHFFGLLI